MLLGKGGLQDGQDDGGDGDRVHREGRGGSRLTGDAVCRAADFGAGLRPGSCTQVFEEGFDERRLAAGRSGDKRSGQGDGPEGGVDGELFHWRLGGSVACLAARLLARLREVGGGDLERIEEEAGAARVNVVGGDAAEDLADGELDGGAVLGQGEIEGGVAGAPALGLCDGLAGGVVEVAEGLATEAGRAAAAAVGVDVAAALALGLGGDGGHAVSSSRVAEVV